jgi:hypothetical protein
LPSDRKADPALPIAALPQDDQRGALDPGALVEDCLELPAAGESLAPQESARPTHC